jgi:SAM-dependent methyltransferase
VPLVQFDLTQCPLPDDFADVTVLLNVLEHVPDHEAAVRHLFRITRPGGAVIIEVRAGSSLFDVFDRALMHCRRYDMAALVALFERAGFTIARKSHLGFFLYPAFYLSKRLNQLRYRRPGAISDQEIAAQMIAGTRKRNALGSFAMGMEEALRPFLPYPKGVRCLITAVKPLGGKQ